MSLSSPGHAVSPFRGEPFWEGFWVRSRGFARRDAQTNGRCQRCISKAIGGANWAPQLPFFIGSGRNVWHWRSFQRRSKNGVLELARPCCFPVPGRAFLGRLLGQKSWFCPSWRPNATEGANGAFRRQLEVQIEPQSCKIFFFYRFWTQRLTLKIIPTQVENGVLELARPCCFPVPGRAFLGRLLGQKSWFCPSWRPNATEGANLEVQIEPHSCKIFIFYRFWTQRLTLKITPTQFENWARQAMLFPCFGARVLGSILGAKSWLGPAWRPNTEGACRSQFEVQLVSQSCKEFYIFL